MSKTVREGLRVGGGEESRRGGSEGGVDGGWVGAGYGGGGGAT